MFSEVDFFWCLEIDYLLAFVNFRLFHVLNKMCDRKLNAFTYQIPDSHIIVSSTVVSIDPLYIYMSCFFFSYVYIYIFFHRIFFQIIFWFIVDMFIGSLVWSSALLSWYLFMLSIPACVRFNSNLVQTSKRFLVLSVIHVNLSLFANGMLIAWSLIMLWKHCFYKSTYLFADLM